MEIKFATDGSWVSVDILSWVFNRNNDTKWREDNPFVRYDIENCYSIYGETETLLRCRNSEGANFTAPYEIIFDYRNKLAEDSSWGKAKISSKDYTFPDALVPHQRKAIEVFEKNKWLKKKNNPAPRVSAYSENDGLPSIIIEKSFYYDQVGTNLTIDMKLEKPLSVDDSQCLTIRKWDIVQSDGNTKLPTFNKSRLANTIGVAVAITAKDKHGRIFMVKRFRSKEVAVYRDMWHLPLSFALFNDFSQTDVDIDIKDLIQFDLSNELMEELSMSPEDFSEPRPLAFCRDLGRGGKPQFFLEMESKIPFELLKKKIKDNFNEFVKKPEEFKHENNANLSPELAAAYILLAG